MTDQDQSSARQRIKLCAIFAERDMRLADQLQSLGDHIAADIYREVAGLWCAMAMLEARQLRADVLQ